MEAVCGKLFQDNVFFFIFLFNVILLLPPYPPPLSLPLSEGGEAPLSLRSFFLKDLFEHAASKQRFPGRIKVQEQKAS